MNDKNLRQPVSGWMVAAVMTSFAAFYLSTLSPMVLILPLGFASSFVFKQRFDRNSGAIWGLRLLVYTALAVLGRTPTGTPSQWVDSQSFTTAGLIAGGELILQSYRVPPPGALFDGWIVSLSGVVFLIACNTYQGAIQILAPLYVLFLLFSLVDLRPRSAPGSLFARARRAGMLMIAVSIGLVLHQTLWAYRGSIIALGARLLTNYSTNLQGNAITENPQLSSSFGSGTSTSRLMHITGSLSDPHLRAAAFDIYRKGTWGPSVSTRKTNPALPVETHEEGADTNMRTDTDAKITVLRDTNGVLFAPLNSAALVPAEGSSFDWDRYQGPFRTDDQPPINYSLVESKTEVDGVQTTQGPLCVAPNAAQREALLRVPDEIDPRVGQLAQKITKDAATQPEKALLIVDYLFKNNKYSLEFARGTEDPVSDFVLNKKAAHCQYFASAATMMLRAVGIPARYVSGYYAHETGDDGATIVRGRDAHAWTEAFIDGFGWITLDATPAAGRADPQVSPLPPYQKTMEWLEDAFARVRNWFGSLTQLQIGGIMALVLIIWGGERWRQSYRKARQRIAGPVPPPELAPLARRFEKVLVKRGVETNEGRPWSESVPQTLEGEREWIDGYNRIRFDQRDDKDEELRELESELVRLEKLEK